MRGTSASNLGIADLPVRLMIAAVVISLSIPLVWSAYSDLSVNNTVASLEREMADLLEIIDNVMNAGTGSTMDAELRVSSWGTARIESLMIGSTMNDTSSSERFLITYRISGYGSGFMSLDPPIPLLSDVGIELTEGEHTLRISHGLAEMGHYCYLSLK